MSEYVYWFMLALALLALEMSIGTFYVLVLAIAAALGGLAALVGVGTVWQLSLAGLAAVAGSVLLHGYRASRPTAPAADNNLDIGQSVKVLQRNADGSARVRYRGADWNAFIPSDTPEQDKLYIRSVQGSTLHLSHLKP